MLFLLPAYLSENTSIAHFSPVVKDYIMQTDYFFVENEKTARKVVKFFAPEKSSRILNFFCWISTRKMQILKKHSN
jgi:16S rRNA (cytidine1402-2'-O)-methyltransferase